LLGFIKIIYYKIYPIRSIVIKTLLTEDQWRVTTAVCGWESHRGQQWVSSTQWLRSHRKRKKS